VPGGKGAGRDGFEQRLQNQGPNETSGMGSHGRPANRSNMRWQRNHEGWQQALHNKARRLRCNSTLALARGGPGARCRQPWPLTRSRNHPKAQATTEFSTQSCKTARLGEQGCPDPSHGPLRWLSQALSPSSCGASQSRPSLKSKTAPAPLARRSSQGQGRTTEFAARHCRCGCTTTEAPGQAEQFGRERGWGGGHVRLRVSTMGVGVTELAA
jgi:hypothetical protein